MQDRRAFLKEAGMMTLFITTGAASLSAQESAPDEAKPRVSLSGDWRLRVEPGTVTIMKKQVRVTQPATLDVAPATLLHIKDEVYDTLPVFNPQAAPWAKGAKLQQLATYETTATDLLVPDTLVLKSGPGDAAKFVQGKDYEVDTRWATIGRIEGGGIKEDTTVWADYDAGWGRIDSVVVNASGQVFLLAGKPHNATPHPPAPEQYMATLANIWIPGRLPKLTQDNLYPIIEPVYPEPKHKTPPAATLLPKTWAKIQHGQPLRIVAWGDSVTAGGQASDPSYQYQNQFAALLQAYYPRVPIQVITAGWGGRNSDSFLNEPPGSQYNFDHAVIEPHPDLVIMEFVNDAYMTPDVVETKYSALLKRFQAAGIEWIILTPHYVRPDWMNVNTVRVEQDPRPYVAGVRQFAARHNVALADASLRWGHLLKEGIPYTTLLSNSINHPDDRGHRLFALALMELFR